ncbi:MAG TPA: DinB family protein [Planctomycetota bacterium]|nr:DinB family protein [Planctomycetota bacterium]
MAHAEHLDLGSALLLECRRRLYTESLPRIRKCLAALTIDEIWARPNPQTVSAGNLILHLSGNVRQYIIATLGGGRDVRERQAEFDATGPVPAKELIDLLEKTLAEAAEVLEEIDPGTLLETHRVQGFVESGLSILVHVVEHFSYHTGQIAYIVKSRKNVDLGFYRGIDLNAKG